MYWRRKITIAKARDYKKDISQLQSLNALTLTDLKKVRRYVAEYPARLEEIKKENTQIEGINKQIDIDNEEAKQKAISEHSVREKKKDILREPIRRRQSQLLGYLMSSKVWFGGFEASISGSRYRLSNAAKPAYEEYLALEKKWSDLNLHAESVRFPEKTPHVAKKKPPPDYTVLRIAGASVRVFYKRFSLEEINDKIKSHEAEEQKEKDKIQEIKARAAANELETRAQAKKFRSDFEIQLRQVECCPYCEESLSLGDAHLDHIYPVSKGGLSTKKNLVFVFSSCNLKKQRNTLRVFVRESGYDFERIAFRLELLGKDF
jgi:hypothetical protein